MHLTKKTVLGFDREQDAVHASATLSELPEFDALPFVVLESGGIWAVECYDDGALAGPDGKIVLTNCGIRASSREVVSVPALDWVAETQRGLSPVRVSRFIVHGSHDRSKIRSQWAIEIDAGRAFGTSHHGTTRGCLMAIGDLPRSFKPEAVLDLGAGTGVLAIAAAKTFGHRARITAIDIDPIAVEVARENCRRNGAGDCVRLFAGDGLKPLFAYARAPFDLVIANILAKPLLKLAPRMRALTKIDGILVLSGLLSEQAREVFGRYRATGFRLHQRKDLEGWATLILRRTR